MRAKSYTAFTTSLFAEPFSFFHTSSSSGRQISHSIFIRKHPISYSHPTTIHISLCITTDSFKLSSTLNGPVPIPSKNESLHVLGLGAATIDLVATVSKYPLPDSKVRTNSFEVYGGGNCGNTLTALRRLGIRTSIISKCGDDMNGKRILQDFCEEGVNVDYLFMKKGMTTSFTYIIVDEEGGTRTCIHTPSVEEVLEDDVSEEMLEGISLVHVDGRHTKAAVKLAKMANERNIPVLLDIEKDRPFVRELLPRADYVVTNSVYPSIFCPEAGDSMILGMKGLLECGRAQFVVSTLGSEGSMMLFRASNGNSNNIPCSPGRSATKGSSLPEISLETIQITGEDYVKLHCSASKPKQIIDTTGAGDAFIGGVAYGIVTGMSYSDTLKLASMVACRKVEAIGARLGLPRWMDLILYDLLERREMRN